MFDIAEDSYSVKIMTGHEWYERNKRKSQIKYDGLNRGK